MARASSKAKKAGKRVVGRPIQPGQVLNPKGRPIGSRQRLTEGFINALSEDFDKHGVRTIAKMREEKPDAYIRVVADLVPADVNLNHGATDSFAAIWQHISTGKAPAKGTPND
jgi:hypothetical protein